MPFDCNAMYQGLNATIKIKISLKWDHQFNSVTNKGNREVPIKPMRDTRIQHSVDHLIPHYKTIVSRQISMEHDTETQEPNSVLWKVGIQHL